MPSLSDIIIDIGLYKCVNWCSFMLCNCVLFCGFCEGGNRPTDKKDNYKARENLVRTPGTEVKYCQRIAIGARADCVNLEPLAQI